MASYQWNNIIKTWENANKTVLIYDIDLNNAMTMQIGFKWDMEQSTWIELFKYEYLYDENGNSAMTIYYIQDNETGNLKLENTETFYYSERTESIIKETKMVELMLNIYPNPVKNTLYIDSPIDIKKVLIFDINGHVIDQQNNMDNIINTSQLKHGVYFLKIITNYGESIKKIIKQ